MDKLENLEQLFAGRHFDREVIILCVRWYLRFKLSLRDLVEMMAERGLSLAHTTIMRWVQHYTPEFEKRWRRYALAVGEPHYQRGPVWTPITPPRGSFFHAESQASSSDEWTAARSEDCPCWSSVIGLSLLGAFFALRIDSDRGMMPAASRGGMICRD